ncbi:hypothetical protein G6F57_019874 [Rhizopus arrhizus]|nr:hypothetical protein G6F57_019874 [Rhizopus arrhizus]
MAAIPSGGSTGKDGDGARSTTGASWQNSCARQARMAWPGVGSLCDAKGSAPPSRLQRRLDQHATVRHPVVAGAHHVFAGLARRPARRGPAWRPRRRRRTDATGPGAAAPLADQPGPRNRAGDARGGHQRAARHARHHVRPTGLTRPARRPPLSGRRPWR